MKFTFTWPWKRLKIQSLIAVEKAPVVSKPSVFPKEPDPEILAFCATNPTEDEFIDRFPNSDLAKYLLECREVFPHATHQEVIEYIGRNERGSLQDLKNRFPNYNINSLFLTGLLKRS